MSEPIVIDTPDGPIEFPVGTSDAKIQEVMAQTFGPPTNLPSDTPIADGFEKVMGYAGEQGQALAQEFGQRKDATQNQFMERTAAGMFGPPGIGVADTGIIAGAGIEYATGRALDAAAMVVPEPVKDYALDLINRGLTAGGERVEDFLANNPEAREGVMALKDGYESVSQWLAKTRPGLAGDFKAIFDIGSAVIPAAKIAPVVDATLGKAGQRLTVAAAKQKQGNQREAVRNFIYPENKIGEGVTDEADSWARQRTYEGSGRENEIAEAMLISDKINANRTYTYNQARAYDAVADYSKELKQTIMKAGNPPVDKDVLLQNIMDGLGDLGKAPGTEMLVGDTKTMAENLLNTAMSLMDSSSGRAMGVLKARQEFDKIVRRARGDQFDATGEKDSAIMAVNRIVRDALNESVRNSLPKSGAGNVYYSLRQQHLLLEGADILRSRMIQEQENVFTRIAHNVARVTHLPKTPLALATTIGVGAGLLQGPVGAAMAIGGGAGLAGWGAKQLVTSPTTKKKIAQMLTGVNTAIKKSENAEMIKTLKADRLLLIEMLREYTSEDERVPLQAAGNE